MKKKIGYTVGSGNVFADLGFADAQEMLAKADLAIQINDIIRKKKLTPVKAAKLLNLDQPEISLLSQGKLADFSLETLFRFLTILGQDVTINISPKARSKTQAHVSVSITKLKKKPLVKRDEVSHARVIHAKKRK